MMALYLFSMFSVAQASGGAWRVSWFCVGELYGKDLSFKFGTSQYCEIPASHSYRRVTCPDGKYEAFLVSNNCAAILTSYTGTSVHLELGDQRQVTYTSKENVITREEAIKRLTLKEAATPNKEISENVDNRQRRNTKDTTMEDVIAAILFVLFIVRVCYIFYRWRVP